MPRIPPLLPLLLLSALVVTACAGATGSQWTQARQARVAAADGQATSSPEPSAAPTSEAQDPSPATTSEAPTDAAEGAGGEGEQAASGDDVVGRIEIRAFDLGFDPSLVQVAEPGRYQVTLQNDGAIYHDLVFDDGGVLVAEAGQTVDGEVVIPEGGLGFLCSVPGHAPAGMTGDVVVAGSEDVATEGADDALADNHGGPAPEADVPADPGAPPPVLHDPAAPPLRDGDVHDIELVVHEREMTVAPGFVQRVWDFGGSVPGPVIRVKRGDEVRVRLVNPAENQLHHSIDFHASQVAWNDEMRSIAPGEELVYEWRADYAGVWMYHCGTAPTLHHIANGMYGMVIVEPEGGLPEADAEFALVQSEWYLGPQGEITSLEKATAANPAPDFVAFNGVADQYAEAPLQVGTGERVRMFVLNAGPSADSSFHVVGTIFDTVIKEGVALLPGNEGGWGSQAVDLAPAQGAIVEFTTAEDGLYPFVTHAFNYVVRGAQGIVRAGDGDPAN